MSRWVAITLSDLNDAKVAKLVDACKTKALGAGQTDPMTRIIADAVLEIRAEIASCQSNQLDADETKVPRDLKALATRMVVRLMQSRLQLGLTDDEQRERDNDSDTLKRIAKCERRVEAPDTPQVPSEVQRVTGVEQVSIDNSAASLTRLDGL